MHRGKEQFTELIQIPLCQQGAALPGEALLRPNAKKSVGVQLHVISISEPTSGLLGIASLQLITWISAKVIHSKDLNAGIIPRITLFLR